VKLIFSWRRAQLQHVLEQCVENLNRDVVEASADVQVDGVNPHLSGAHPGSFSGRDRAALNSACWGIPILIGEVTPLEVEVGLGVLKQVPQRLWG
jgi:hypothetical protein